MVNEKNVYMILDRSGSMISTWDETLGSINGYVEKLEDDVNVYLSAFDYIDKVEMVELRNTKAGAWQKLTRNEIEPRGSTPLYDACARVMDKMLSDNPERAIFVVITDGYENASKEYKLDTVKTKLKLLEDKKWPTIFLGADFSNVTTYVNSTFNVSSANIVNTTGATRGMAMNMMATKSEVYFNESNTAYSSAMAFTPEEQALVSGETTTQDNTIVKKPNKTTTIRAS